MKKIFLVIILLAGVAYVGSQIYITNKNQQAQVSGAVVNITNGQLITTSVAQGGTITFKLYTTGNQQLTTSQLAKLYIEPIGPNKPIMTITRTGTDTYSAQIPTNFPVGTYEISIFPRLNSGTDMNWYFNESLTVTAAPVVVTPPVAPPTVPPVVTPPVVVVPPVVVPPIVTPPVANQSFSATPPPSISGSSNGLDVGNIKVDNEDGHIRISWTNTKLTHGFVDYGTTASYGKTEKTQTHSFVGRTADHLVRLSGILPNTTYHFRIRVEAEGGVKARTIDGTFFSGPNPGWMSIISPNNDVILQNGKTEKIFWYTNYQTLPIDMYLMGGKLSAPVKLKSSNAGHASFGVNMPQRNGQETIQIPSTTIAPPGWGYYISIRINNTEVAKSANFEIAQNKGPIGFSTPVTTFKKGETYTVTWNRNDSLYSGGINIELYSGNSISGNRVSIYNYEPRSATNSVIKAKIRVRDNVLPGKYKLKLTELNSFGVVSYRTTGEIDVVVTE